MKKQKVKSTPISIRLSNEQLSALKILSHKLSLERNEDLNYVDLIKEAIDKTYSSTVAKA